MREQALPVREISRQALYRLPFYLSYLKKAEADGVLYISAPKVAADLDLNEVQVRKDIAKVSSCAGKPKIGYETAKLIKDLEKFLGYDNTTDAVVVGVGSLGSSLLHYDGFSECGFRIVAGFDAVNFDEEPFKKEKPVFPMRKLGELCERLKVHMAVIAVPADSAQDVCDELVKSGILAILNFTPVHLSRSGHTYTEYEYCFGFGGSFLSYQKRTFVNFVISEKEIIYLWKLKTSMRLSIR